MGCIVYFGLHEVHPWTKSEMNIDDSPLLVRGPQEKQWQRLTPDLQPMAYDP